MVEEAFSEGELQQFSSHPGNVHHLQIIIINKKYLDHMVWYTQS